MSHPRLILLALNEINFDLVKRYLEHDRLPGFRRLITSFKTVETFAEDQYANLEPWIQWVSIHTGKRFDDHGVFRLGDMVHNDISQIFEVLEKAGLSVGAVSPMNARNDLKDPAYFIPDPWTATPADESPFSRRLADMLRQTVNDNARGRISASSLLTLCEAVVRTAHMSTTPQLLKLILKSRKRPWLKSLILDQLIHMVHLHLLRRRQPDVSFVFLNAGAHMQHHYFFNSRHSGVPTKNPNWYVPADADPISDMLHVYDRILQDYFKVSSSNSRLIVATGLTQVPYDKVKFYYRLSDHKSFLTQCGIEHQDVYPRMTRDFEIVFADRSSAEAGMHRLSSMRMAHDDLPMFGEIEDRGQSIFATLTYPKEIKPSSKVCFDNGIIVDFALLVDFVAIKNGMHSTKGFAFVGPEIGVDIPDSPVHVAQLFEMIAQAATQ